VQSWSFALLAAEGARRADKAGKLTREGIKEALEGIKDWDMYGFYAGRNSTTTPTNSLFFGF